MIPKLRKYLAELKRRHVVKACVAYLVVAWLIAEVISTVLPIFDLSPSVIKVVMFVLGIGFPIWLLFSWVYDLTPEGIKKTDEIEPDEAVSAKTSVILNRIIIVALSVALILLLANQFRTKKSSSAVPNRTTDQILLNMNFKPLCQSLDLSKSDT